MQGKLSIISMYEPVEDMHYLLLGKGLYHYKYMDVWEKFQEQMLRSQKVFHSGLEDEDITGEDYRKYGPCLFSGKWPTITTAIIDLLF